MSGCDVDTGDDEGDTLFSSVLVGHKVTASCKDITPGGWDLIFWAASTISALSRTSLPSVIDQKIAFKEPAFYTNYINVKGKWLKDELYNHLHY